MLREKRPKASYGLAWSSREERPEIPSQCYQQSEIQLFYVSPWGKCEESCFSSHRNAVPNFSASAVGKCRTWSWRKWIMFTLRLEWAPAKAEGSCSRTDPCLVGWSGEEGSTALPAPRPCQCREEPGHVVCSSSLVSSLPGRSIWIIYPMHSSGGSRRNKSGSLCF